MVESERGSFGWSREEHDRRQAALGLELSPVERLEWLERTLEELGSLLGRARQRGAGRSAELPRDPGRS